MPRTARRRIPDTDFPRPMHFKPDATTEAVLDLVGRRFGNRFGDLEPFWFAVTRADARRALTHFVKTALADFGDHQDAMLDGEDWLFHSSLSQYLNCGLLTPREVGLAVLEAHRERELPLNSVEGFIRQILGLARVRARHLLAEDAGLRRAQRARWQAQAAGLLLVGRDRDALHGPRHRPDEARGAVAPHSTADGDRQLRAARRRRSRQAICEWYLAVYADAFEWVELPNTAGMVMYADGGYLASKPYAASGNYIHKMSNFCGSCRFKVKEKLGPDACPFNYLYWNFMIENEKRLRRNPRMGPIFKTLERMSDDRREAIIADARSFLDALAPADPKDYR